MKDKLPEIIEAFVKWKNEDQHHIEDAYPELKTKDYLLSLDRDAFIEFFFQFVREGGKIQSGGARTAGKFKTFAENNYELFKAYILEPYDANFNIDNWLINISKINYFGPGSATIYLSRIDKNRFTIVNNKSQNALKALGYEIKGDLVGVYHSID